MYRDRDALDAQAEVGRKASFATRAPDGDRSRSARGRTGGMARESLGEIGLWLEPEPRPANDLGLETATGQCLHHGPIGDGRPAGAVQIARVRDEQDPAAIHDEGRSW
jgi:hypothetical protein